MGKDRATVPKAVYYQCIWIIKDIDRLRRLEAASKLEGQDGEPVFFVDEDEMIRDADVLNMAVWKLACIRAALDELPHEYRQHTLDNIVYNIPLSDLAHENTWRRWRSTFIKALAKNLKLV